MPLGSALWRECRATGGHAPHAPSLPDTYWPERKEKECARKRDRLNQEKVKTTSWRNDLNGCIGSIMEGLARASQVLISQYPRAPKENAGSLRVWLAPGRQRGVATDCRESREC